MLRRYKMSYYFLFVTSTDGRHGSLSTTDAVDVMLFNIDLLCDAKAVNSYFNVNVSEPFLV